MKPHVPILSALLLLTSSTIHAQITTPSIKASFGVEADLRSNFFNGLPQVGNDDWFSRVTGDPVSIGIGIGLIDTIGAA